MPNPLLCSTCEQPAPDVIWCEACTQVAYYMLAALIPIVSVSVPIMLAGGACGAGMAVASYREHANLRRASLPSHGAE